jgi:hypothetical protein
MGDPVRRCDVVLTLGCLAVMTAQAQQQSQSPPLAPGALVAALDEQFQVRFLDTKLGFGISRLCGPMGHRTLKQLYEGPRKLPQPRSPGWRNPECGPNDWAPFRPGTKQEKWVADEIARGKVEIWTLLAGEARRQLEGPVVAGNDNPKGLDGVREELLRRVKLTPIPEGDIGGWKVVVRAVRAVEESCVRCHTAEPVGETGILGGAARIKGLKLRDPLGYLIYVYRRRG